MCFVHFVWIDCSQSLHSQRTQHEPPYQPMSTDPSPREMLDRLESRHDKLLERLDQLNEQIEKALCHAIQAKGSGE